MQGVRSILVIGAVVCGPQLAFANPEQALRAENLFREGKAALERGDYKTGCPMLAESQRLDPAGGTLLALALCYEGWGKDATAWAIFKEAEAMAARQGRDDRAQIARERILALEPGLSYLTIVVAPTVPDSVSIRLNRELLSHSDLGVKSAVDRGEYQVRAEHGGLVYFERTLVLERARSIRIEIPAPPPPPQMPPESQAPTTPKSTPVAAAEPPATPPSAEGSPLFGGAVPHVVLGVGAGLLAAGSFFGYRAWLRQRRVEANCPADPGEVCASRYEQDDHNARTDARRSTWFTATGLLGLGAAGYLLLKEGSTGQDTASAVVLAPAAQGARVWYSGRF